MTKRFRIGFVLLLLSVIGGIVWLALRPSEPVYKGKRLSEWLEGYEYHSIPLEEVTGAVRQMGTNAIPALLHRLRAKDSPLTLRLVALAQRQHLFKVKFTPAPYMRGQGYYGFLALGANGKDAVPELVKMYEQDDPVGAQNFVPDILSNIGPAAEQAVPMLVRSLGNSNPENYSNAIRALGGIHAQPKIVVPVLIKFLSDQDAGIRTDAAQAIGAFGSDAKLAVPDLVKLLADPNGEVKDAASKCLKQIDSEAAEKAGVVK